MLPEETEWQFSHRSDGATGRKKWQTVKSQTNPGTYKATRIDPTNTRDNDV